MELHEVEIFEVPVVKGPFKYTDHIATCSCGAFMRSLPGWVQTRQGIEARVQRHKDIAEGRIDTTSTTIQEKKLRNFMIKVNEFHPEQEIEEPEPELGSVRRPHLVYEKDS